MRNDLTDKCDPRTNIPTAEELEGSPTESFLKFTPNSIYDRLFGDLVDQPEPQVEALLAHCALRRVPITYVYIASTNSQHEEILAFLFRDIPSRLIRLKVADFFSDDQLQVSCQKNAGETEIVSLNYWTMDRYVNLYGAIALYGAPALVICSDFALSYMATDANGGLLGGGISAGLAAKSTALFTHTGGLPALDPYEMDEALEKCQTAKQALPTFSIDTKESMMQTALRETKLMLEDTLADWLALMETTSTTEEEGAGAPPIRIPGNIVCITGCEGFWLQQLLVEAKDEGDDMSSNPGVVERSKSGPPAWRSNVSFQFHKHLPHHAIRALLSAKSIGWDERSIDQRLRDHMIGQRVAVGLKRKGVGRATVISVVLGANVEKDRYSIEYDNNEVEVLNVAQLYGTSVSSATDLLDLNFDIFSSLSPNRCSAIVRRKGGSV